MTQNFSAEKIKFFQDVFVKVDGAELYCKQIGKGEPLIIVHGGPGLSHDYLADLEILAKNHLVIFYDQRGMGKSSGLLNEYSINLFTFIEDLHAVQKYFNFQTVSLLGHSWGAYLAMSYAAQYTDKINRLIVANSIPIVQLEPPQYDLYEKMIADILNSEACKNENRTEMIQFYKDTFYYFFVNPSLVDKLKLDNMSAKQIKDSAIIHKLFQNNFYHQPHDLRPSLAKIKNIPTLIVHSNKHDIPESVAYDIQSAIPNAMFALFENSGHFPYIEQPEKFYQVVTEFLTINASQS